MKVIWFHEEFNQEDKEGEEIHEHDNDNGDVCGSSLEKNSGQFCNNSVHGWWWWWWCCCVGFMGLLVERWAEPGCGSSCTGLLPAAARDCRILRRMIWNGVRVVWQQHWWSWWWSFARATILQLHRSQHGWESSPTFDAHTPLPDISDNIVCWNLQKKLWDYSFENPNVKLNNKEKMFLLYPYAISFTYPYPKIKKYS